jgi:hypothetical protein
VRSTFSRFATLLSIMACTLIAASALSATAAPNPIEFQLFKLEPAPPSPNFSGALFEPPVGLYLGAYVEQEPDIGLNQMFKLTYVLKNNHAIYFRYHTLLRSAEDATAWKPIFPTQFAYVAKNSGAGIHLALEPAKNLPLEAITENVIRPFAEAARDAEQESRLVQENLSTRLEGHARNRSERGDGLDSDGLPLAGDRSVLSRQRVRRLGGREFLQHDPGQWRCQPTRKPNQSARVARSDLSQVFGGASDSNFRVRGGAPFEISGREGLQRLCDSEDANVVLRRDA